jgi:hypothetical protein
MERRPLTQLLVHAVTCRRRRERALNVAPDGAAEILDDVVGLVNVRQLEILDGDHQICWSLLVPPGMHAGHQCAGELARQRRCRTGRGVGGEGVRREPLRLLRHRELEVGAREGSPEREV